MRGLSSGYVYALVSGKLAKSYVGTRVNKLFQVSSLSELWMLLFDDPIPSLPEFLLAKQIEEKAEKRFIKEFSFLLSQSSKPEPVSLQLLRSYDYENLKKINFVLSTGDLKDGLPKISDIGKLSQVFYKKWPKLESMTKDTPFSWYKKPFNAEQVLSFENKLDTQYVKFLLKAVQSYSGENREAIQNLIGEELKINNVIWAIRLRLYYNMNNDEIKSNLIWAGEIGSKNDFLAESALKTLSLPLDSFKEWNNFEYANLLNPEVEGDFWQIDPRWMQRTASIKLNALALSMFHKFPCSEIVLIPWFKIKKHELDCIRTATERLCLNVDVEQAKEFVGV